MVLVRAPGMPAAPRRDLRRVQGMDERLGLTPEADPRRHAHTNRRQIRCQPSLPVEDHNNQCRHELQTIGSAC